MFRHQICLLFIIFITCTVFGQDPHYSQFFANPLSLNPALTGSAPGKYRVTAQYRDQWRGALDFPLKTFGASGELKFPIGKLKKRPDLAGAGFYFGSDRVGSFELNTNQIQIFGAYHKSLNSRYNQYLSGGAYFGIVQRSISYEDLNFQDMFNAIDGYDLPTAELLPANNLAFLDIGIGLNYFAHPSKSLAYYGGISLGHITRPNVSFYGSDGSPNPNLVKINKLFIKTSGYIGSSLKTSEYFFVEPRVLALIQGPHTEVNIGSNMKIKIKNYSTRYLHFGPWIRFTDNENGFGLESIILSAGYEFDNTIIGISYDHNLSDIIRDYKGINAFELNITYTGEYENNDGFCPKF